MLGSRLAVLARVMVFGLAAMLLTACLQGEPRNGVPKTSASIAAGQRLPASTSASGATRWRSIPPERLVELREQRLAAAKADPTHQSARDQCADAFGRRQQRRVRRRHPHRLDRDRHEAEIRHRHRHQHRRADRALRLPRIRPTTSSSPRRSPPSATRTSSSASAYGGIISTAAFTSNEPLRKMLDKYITDEVIAAGRDGIRQGPPAADRHHQPRRRPAGDLEHGSDRRQRPARQEQAVQGGHPCLDLDPRRLSADPFRRRPRTARPTRRCMSTAASPPRSS